MRQDPATSQIRILVGGAAFWGNEDLWKEMGADGFAADASTAVRLASDLTGAN
jgi:methanogenic corrinoid protein MtbC1